MNGFFSGLILVGISLIIVSFIMIMYDRKRDVEEKNELISLKKELRGLLEDSNDMVDELNKFSDYIVTTVDEKCTEFKNLMKDTAASTKAPETELPASVEALPETTVTDRKPIETNLEESIISQDENSFSEDIEPISSASESKNNGANPRHTEVMRLFESGMSDAEIAKTLNMGKGEVQLIVGLNLHKLKV